MPPYSTRTLKRKYAGKYQSSGKRRAVYAPARSVANRSYTVRQGPSRRIEVKAVAFTQTATALATSGALQTINLIAQGDDLNQRDGKMVKLHSVEGQLYFYPGTGPAAVWMICLIWDKKPNGVAAVASDIFDAATLPCVQRQDTKNRFTILKQWNENGLYSNTATQSFTESPYTFKNFNLSLKGKYMHFTGTTAAIGSIDEGALYVYVIGSQTTFDYQYKTLVSFTDM